MFLSSTHVRERGAEAVLKMSSLLSSQRARGTRVVIVSLSGAQRKSGRELRRDVGEEAIVQLRRLRAFFSLAHNALQLQ